MKFIKSIIVTACIIVCPSVAGGQPAEQSTPRLICVDAAGEIEHKRLADVKIATERLCTPGSTPYLEIRHRIPIQSENRHSGSAILGIRAHIDSRAKNEGGGGNQQ